MLLLDNLGYVEIGGTDVAAWEEFATQLLGLEVAERTDRRVALRMDDRCQRITVTSDRSHTPFTLGWEVTDKPALDRLCACLEDHNVSVNVESPSTVSRRGVEDLVSFCDPLGNKLEAFVNLHAAGRIFRPARSISGFRTGRLGLGHAVLTVERIDEVMPFYQDILGFRLSDYTLAPFKAYFFHINPRHHSLAFIETGTNGLHHLMMELLSLDDVGQAYDIAQTSAERIGVTLGRHSNDLMTSFYTKTPSPFLVEYGWGGSSIDSSNWKASEYKYGPSLWGHERTWLSSEKRAEARALRFKAASLGIRAPVQVLEGNYTLVR